MIKIFTTQLNGYFNRILDQEEFQIEDGARLLAQAIVGEGAIYIYGSHEMAGILNEALYGAEPLRYVKPLKNLDDITQTDRVLLFSRFSHDDDVIEKAKQLSQKGISMVGVSTIIDHKGESLEEYVDIHIDTKLKKPLIPTDDGSRTGFPSLMLSLYVYYCLTFTLKEILSEYE